MSSTGANIDPTPAAYTQGNPFQVEKQALFANAWLPLGHVAQLPHRGDYCAHAIGGWPVFALRGDDGEVRAFRNVCRHQGMQVMDQPSGNCAQLRCRFHGWTYDLAGRFVTAPDPVAPQERGQGVNDLAELPVAIAQGFAFGTLRERGALDARDVEAAMRAALPLGSGSHGGSLTVDVGCNWKTCLEQRVGIDGAAFALWPLLLVHAAGAGAIVEQVIPRTFLRTRVILHAIGDVGPDALERAGSALRTSCEALQAQRAGGAMPERTGAIGALWERLDRALAGA